MTNRLKVIYLWGIFLFGIIFHGNLAMAPLFWGQSIAMPEELIAKHAIEPNMWMMLMIWLIPMIIIVATLFIAAKWYRITNFILSILLSLMNVWHLLGHLGETPIDIRQIALLTFVLISGILLNIVSFKWIRE